MDRLQVYITFKTRSKDDGAGARGKLLSSVAEAYARPGIDPEKALRAGEESLELHNRVGDPYEIVQSHRTLADVHLTRGEVNEAAFHISKAQRMFEEAGQTTNPVMGWILRTQGDVFLLQGDFQSGRDCYEQALKIFRERRVGTGIAIILKRLGLWELKHGSARLALGRLNEAVAQARTVSGATYLLAEVLLSRIEAGLFIEQWSTEHLTDCRQGDSSELAMHIGENDRLQAEFVKLVQGKDDLAVLRAHFSYLSKRSEITIGVANSVSFTGSPDTSFDPSDTLAYAVEHNFRLVQVYLNRWTADTDVRERLVQKAQCHGIRLMCHAPGLLNRYSVTGIDIVGDAHAVLQNAQKKWVVYHFDEKESIDVALDLVAKINESGLVPCLENYHQLEGPAQARKNYRLYLELFRGISAEGLSAYAVLDIPRLFHTRLKLSVAEASVLTMDVVRCLTDLNIPILLHLIDSHTFEQERKDWCPLGEGAIPFATLLTQLFAATSRVEAVVFEFEDKRNPLASRPFLEECIRGSVALHHPQLSVRWIG